MRSQFLRRPRCGQGRCHRRSHEDSRRLSARPGDGCRPQPLCHHAGRRAGSHSGSGDSRRGQGRRADRPHPPPGRAPAHGRGRRHSLHPHRRRHPGRLRGDGRHVGAEIWKRFQSRSICTKPPRPRPNGRIWKIFAAASSREFATKSRPIRRASPISASRACIRQPEPPWLARASL
jgi:hypothetical protein